MKFYKYIKKTIKNNLSHRSFKFFLRSWNLNKKILKCSLVKLWYDNSDDHDFFSLKNVLPLKIYLGYMFF